jgi:glycosyltransferase involved in cell wall biosynthesis/peptidoglycan/xylan/chitin deacetylase (PgdA/CDA1 family)
MTPDMTIVIPTRDRRERLLQTIESLEAQSAAAGTFDVLVVADGCTDGTQAAVEAAARSQTWAGGRLRCIDQEWQGASAARNTGLREATGRVVLFLDDDVTADSHLVASHLRHHEPHEGADDPMAPGAAAGTAVVGRIEPERRPEVMHRQIRRWWLEHDRRLATRAPTFTDVYTGNLSVARVTALAVGGLDPSLDYAEDVEFGFRLASEGARIIYDPQARVRTTNTKSAVALLDDLRRSGRGSVRIHRKHPQILGALPLGGYGETTLRVRLARATLLQASRLPPVRAAIRVVFDAWAIRTRSAPLDRAIFELVRGYEYWSGVRDEARNEEWSGYSSPGVPVLVYHRVEPAPAADAGPYVIASSTFGRQLSLIRRLGFTVRPLESVVDAWTRGVMPPAHTAAITFDDGYRDSAQHAWPVLQRHDYPATLFAVSGLLGRDSAWDEGVGGGPAPLLTAVELADLDKQGFRVGSHSVTHADLRVVGAAVASAEAVDSRHDLERLLGRSVDLFAYPYGLDSREVQGLAAAAGYRAAFATRPGLNTPATPRHGLRRIVVLGTDDLLTFAIKVVVGDDPRRHVRAWLRIRR